MKLTINIEVGDAGLFHATSPQIPELFVSGSSVLQTLEMVPDVVGALWLLTGRKSGEAGDGS